MRANAGPERRQARCGPWGLVEWPVLIGCNAASASVSDAFRFFNSSMPFANTADRAHRSCFMCCGCSSVRFANTADARGSICVAPAFAISSRTERPARTAPDGRSHQGRSECRLREQVGNAPNVRTGRWTCCNRTRVPRPVTKRSPSTKRLQPRRPKQA